MNETYENYHRRPATLKVFVGGLPQNWGSDHVGQLMQNFGKVVNIEIKRDETEFSKSYGFAYLQNHIPTNQIYGKHQYYNAVIEIKELNQRFMFMSITGGKLLSEEEIVGAFHEQGHSVERIEIGNHSYKPPSVYAKVTLTNESSAKWYINRKNVKIRDYAYKVSQKIEGYKGRQDPSKHRDLKGNHYGRYTENDRYPQMDMSNIHEDDKVNLKQYTPSIATPDNHQSDAEKSEIKVTPYKSKPNITQSSGDDANNLHIKEAIYKPKRKLSYRGKDVAFHPTPPATQMDQSSAIQPEIQSLIVGNLHLRSPNQKQISVISQSKLSSSSRDWGVENLMMWSDPILGANMAFPAFALQNSPPFIPLINTKSQEWTAMNSSQSENVKKNKVWIKFFTYPGCA